MVVCKYCNKKFSNKRGFSKHENRCSIISKKELEKLYLEDKLSAIEIAEKINVNYSVIYKLLKYHKIKTRSGKEYSLLANNKREKTNIEKTGFKHNFCKNSPSRKKWEKRLLAEEGIVNVFQRESVKKKSIKTLIQRYGVESPNKLNTSLGKNTYSKIHRQIVELLQNMGIEVMIEYKIKKNTTGYYSYDILIKNTNKIIEVYGDYWHGNPKIYSADDLLLKKTNREMTAKQKWELDKRKNNFARSTGHRLIVIWEYDIKNNIEKVKKKIKKFHES